MSYRYDKDLKFLGKCTNEELKKLFNILVYDPKDGGERFSSTLTLSDEYKKYGSDYSKYWQRIAEELQLYGGNTFANIFRGSTGVLYREILEDVAKNLKVPYTKFSSTQEIEENVLEKVLFEVFSKISEDEAKKLFSEFSDDELVLKNLNTSLGVNGAPWGKIGLSLVNKGLTRVVGGLLTGPVGLVLNAWIVADIAGPATRVTVPAVMLIATLRKKKMQNL